MAIESEEQGMILAKRMVRDVAGWGKEWVQITNAALREQRDGIAEMVHSMILGEYYEPHLVAAIRAYAGEGEDGEKQCQKE